VSKVQSGKRKEPRIAPSSWRPTHAKLTFELDFAIYSKGENLMLNRFRLALACLVVIVSVGIAAAQNQTPQTPQTKDQMPDISGDWTGTWGIYSPAQGTTPA
jgi:hypothetical protein